MSKPKQIIVIRKDLKMRRGKEIAQGSHASLAFLSKKVRKHIEIPPMFKIWEVDRGPLPLTVAERLWIEGSFAKVTLQVNSEEELLEVHQRALDADLESHLIIDSGLTEFNGVPTPTAVGIGPDFPEKFAEVTDNLKLY